MKYEYTPSGVCANAFNIEIVDGIVKDLKINGGCHGNTRGIELLCIGRKAEEVASLLEGIECGKKGTSCPDQISKALKAAPTND